MTQHDDESQHPRDLTQAIYDAQCGEPSEVHASDVLAMISRIGMGVCPSVTGAHFNLAVLDSLASHGRKLRKERACRGC